MELKFKPKSVTISERECIDADKCEVNVSCAYTSGKLSQTVIITIEDPLYEDGDAYIMIDINKNQAIYLANFLLSFANEIDINPDYED